MKPAVLGMFAFLILLLGGIAAATIEGRTTRINELDQCLDTAMGQSMQVLKGDGKYAIRNNKELVADMIQNFLGSTQALNNVAETRHGKEGFVDRSDAYEITVHAVDMKKGLLDVTATRKYARYGLLGSVSVRKTVVLDEHSDVKNACHVVRFIEKNRMVKSGESGTEKLPSGEWVTKKDVIVKSLRIKHGETLRSTDFPEGYAAILYEGRQYTKDDVGSLGESYADGFGILKDIDIELVSK